MDNKKLLEGIFVGGLSLSAFLIGKAYGTFKTNKEYQKIIEPYFNKIKELNFKEINEILTTCIKIEEK